jgi:serine/threonine protein kinase/tetratricopeptide (TPR) repeat protein
MALIPWGGPRKPVPAVRLRAFPADSVLSPAGRSFSALLEEFDQRWQLGDRPRAEDYLDAVGPDEAVELIYHEFCRAELEGLTPSRQEFVQRFPAHRERLARLFGLLDVLDGPAGPGLPARSELPETGDEIGPYRLLRELGRGSFARVFLAEQADLEDRLVVVKVSARGTAEPHLLARAQHPGIVGLLRHVEANDGALQVLSMPFLGGAPLSRVLAVCRRRRRGSDLLAALDRAAAPEYRPAGSPGPSRSLVAGMSYAQAVSWLVARLAEALDHAHRRGVAHGDIKPSNILLTADAWPMLLDFNLALDWTASADHGGSSDPGGTLAYMAPERLRALAEGPQPGLPGPSQRHRADLYALGLVLVEALGARLTGPEADGRSSPRGLAARMAEHRGEAFVENLLRKAPAGLRPILARCLAHDPAHRYRSSAELAIDLDRFRQDLPPTFAPRPQGETAPARWIRRNARLVACAGLLLGGIALVVAATSGHFRASLGGLAQAKFDALFGSGDPDVYRLQRQGGYRDPAGAETLAAQALRNLSHYDVLEEADWWQRDDVRYLAEPLRDDLTVWLLEQAWRYGTAIADRPDASPADLARARLVLARTSPGRPPEPLADLDRRLARRQAATRAAIGKAASPRVLPGWMDEYLRGVATESSDPARARRHYLAALRDQPASFWARYRLAFAAWRTRDYRTAAGALRECIHQRPANPRLRIAQAGLLYHLGRPDLAHDQLQEAVRLDPASADAYRTFAFSRFALGQEEQLAADFARFDQIERSRGLDDSWATLQDARWLLAARGRRLPPIKASDLLRLRAAAEEDHDARIFLACCLDDAGQHQEALEQARLVLEADPDHLIARLTYALLLQKTGDLPEATVELRRVVDDPRFQDILDEDERSFQVYRYLASDLLVYNHVEESRQVLRRGLERLEASLGAEARGHQPGPLNRLRGEFHYSLARVEAAAVKDCPERAGKAAEHLSRALRELPDEAARWYRSDRIFEPIRDALGRLPEGPKSTPGEG